MLWAVIRQSPHQLFQVGFFGRDFMVFFQTFSYRLIIIVLVSEPEVRPLDEVDVFEDLVQQILPGRFSLKMFSFSKIFLWRKHSLMWLGIWSISSEECVLNKSIKIRQIKRRYFCCCRHTIADSLALVGFREKKNQKISSLIFLIFRIGHGQFDRSTPAQATTQGCTRYQG